jgi:hypothetical protein
LYRRIPPTNPPTSSSDGGGGFISNAEKRLPIYHFYFPFESRLFDIYEFFVCNPGTFFSFLGGEHGRKKGEELTFARQAQDDGRQKRQVEEIGVGG